VVREVGHGSIVLRAFVDGVRDVVAMELISNTFRGQIAETDVWSFWSRES
jgi:hypothetical protein